MCQVRRYAYHIWFSIPVKEEGFLVAWKPQLGALQLVPHCQLYVPPPFALPSHWPSGLVLKCTKHTFPLPRTHLLQVDMYVSPSHTSGVCTKKPSVIPVNRTRPPSPSSTYSNPFPDSFFFCKCLFPLGVSHIFICQIFYCLCLLTRIYVWWEKALVYLVSRNCKL